MTTPTDREARLAEALRQNLRRRKAQVRDRGAGTAPGEASDPGLPHGADAG